MINCSKQQIFQALIHVMNHFLMCAGLIQKTYRLILTPVIIYLSIFALSDIHQLCQGPMY